MLHFGAPHGRMADGLPDGLVPDDRPEPAGPGFEGFWALGFNVPGWRVYSSDRAELERLRDSILAHEKESRPAPVVPVA